VINEKLKIKAYLYVMIVVSVFVHLLIGVYFIFYGVYSIVVLSVFDIFVYVVAYFTNRANKIRLTSFIVTIKIA